jgi:hypothetical protein
MGAGVLSREGFLASDLRPLGEILDADRSAVERLGLSHRLLAGRLAEILVQAISALGAAVDVGDDLQAVYREAMGRIPCPWGEGLRFPKGEVELTHRPSGRTIRFSPLSVHLVGEHGFYQGKGSRYRLEPEVVCDILAMGELK